MDAPPRVVSGAVARSRIAHRWLEPDDAVRLGTIVLHPHQRDALERSRRLLEVHGGAILADAVGLGKTYVALALASEARSSLVIAPASLRSMWAGAARATGVPIDFMSYEALSRRSLGAGADVIILDEAHHVRTPSTNRYRHLAASCASARVLALTATPIHNSPRDLRALLALFLGARAWTLEDVALPAFLIRREAGRDSAPSLPALAPPRRIALADDPRLLEMIVALPAPVPPCDGGDGGALVAFTLARLWASSHAALRHGVRRRVHRARAIEDSLAQGRYPSTAELRAWTLGDDATTQLAFPELVVASSRPNAGHLAAAVRTHAEALEALLCAIPDPSPLDIQRAQHLLSVHNEHRPEQVIAFTQFADTARFYFRALSHRARVCQLDGRSGRIASGRISRHEALERFAPRAMHVPPPPAGERIDVLITTDLLSEGVNLQNASVVVHLDLPWTVARLEQRIGRSRRLGARHAATTVYAFMPPADAEVLLHHERRLREKWNAAARLTGACGLILPAPLRLTTDSSPPDESPLEQLERVRGRVRAWRRGAPGTSMRDAMVAFVQAPAVGALALLALGDRSKLVAVSATAVSERPGDVVAAAEHASGSDKAPDPEALQSVLSTLDRWRMHRDGADAAGGARSIGGTARRRAIQRIAQISARTPRHKRLAVRPLTAEARRIVTASYGIGAERVLDELVSAVLPDEAWLRAVRAFGDANIRRGEHAEVARQGAVEAIILFSP